MKTYKITYEVQAVIYASSEARASAEVTDILWASDSGIADYAVVAVQRKSIESAANEK